MQLGAGEHFFAIDGNLDCVAADFELDGDPLITGKGVRAGLGDSFFIELTIEESFESVDHDQVSGRSVTLAEAAEELHFEGGRELFIFKHRGCGLAMDHESIVALCPTRSPFDLITDEAVFGTQFVVRKFGVVEQVAELSFELAPFGIIDGEKPVFHGEGVIEVHPDIMFGKFRGPTGEVFAVKKGDPFLVFGFLCAGWQCEKQESERSEE